jgi:predicted transcriptional regulator of viral defense system
VRDGEHYECSQYLRKKNEYRYFKQVLTMTMLTAPSFINALAAQGQFTFTTVEAIHALGGSDVAVRAALGRLTAKGELASPSKGFYTIVPPEYRRLGCLPADQFLPQLMKHLDQTYYVALLSAAELHGAAHQRPQGLQVMVRSNRRPIVCGKVRVQFYARKDLEHTAIVERNTPRGRIRVASPEATALELVGYGDQCAGLDNVISVLAELVDVLDKRRLKAAAKICPVAWVQRLGYLLDLAGHENIAVALISVVAARVTVLAPLVRSRPITQTPRSERWKLAINAAVEPEE